MKATVEGEWAYARRKQFRTPGVEGQVIRICFSKISHSGTWAYSEVKATQIQPDAGKFPALALSIRTQCISYLVKVALSLIRNRRAALITRDREWGPRPVCTKPSIFH